MAIRKLVEAQWAPESPGQSIPLSFWTAGHLSSSPLHIPVSRSLCQTPFCPGEGPGSGASVQASRPYSPMLGGVHLPGRLSLRLLCLPGHHYDSAPGKTAERQENRWGPATGAVAKGPRGMLAAKGAEPERALQELLAKVGTFPGQELLLEQPWVLENFSARESSSKLSRLLVGCLKGHCPTSYRCSLAKLPRRGPIVGLFPN